MVRRVRRWFFVRVPCELWLQFELSGFATFVLPTTGFLPFRFFTLKGFDEEMEYGLRINWIQNVLGDGHLANAFFKCRLLTTAIKHFIYQYSVYLNCVHSVQLPLTCIQLYKLNLNIEMKLISDLLGTCIELNKLRDSEEWQEEYIQSVCPGR